MELIQKPEKCDGCGICVKVCPQKILKIEDKKMVVTDISRCIGCCFLFPI